MKFQIGAMSLGDILDRGLRIFLARVPVFYAINLLVLLPVIAIEVLVPFFLAPANFGAAILANLAIIVLSLILQPIATAAILHVISQEFIDQRVGMGDAIRFALGRFGRLFVAPFLAGLAIGIGALFCIVPGILFANWYAFVAQVVVVEASAANGP